MAFLAISMAMSGFLVTLFRHRLTRDLLVDYVVVYPQRGLAECAER